MEVKKLNSIFLVLIALVVFSVINSKEVLKKENDKHVESFKLEEIHKNGKHNENNAAARKVHTEKTGKSQTNTTQNEICRNNNLTTSPFNTSQCDIITDGPICISGLNRVLVPSATPKGLIGYWNFDENQPIDSSGLHNHAKGKSLAGAAFGGEGASALFASGDYLEVPFNKVFVTNEFSVTFWLYLVQDFYSNKSTRFCPLIQRGDDDLSSKIFRRAPALYYDRKEKTIRLYVKTTNSDITNGESVTSNATISPQRWLHIGIIKSGYIIKIYVNGILDNEVTTTQNLENNEGPFYIGNVPWLKEQCDFPFLIDELRYYNIAIDEDRLQAEASPALGGIEPNFIQLGCMDCSLKDAAKACIDSYHLCTSIELHTGGYQVARSMGWLKWNTHIWSHGALKNAKKFKKLKGISLCCADLK